MMAELFIGIAFSPINAGVGKSHPILIPRGYFLLNLHFHNVTWVDV